MQVTDEIVTMGVIERPFRFEVDGAVVPGILWRPEDATGPTPLVLLGHGGTQHKRAANVLGLARRFVRHLGVSAVALDAPGHGERVVDEELAEAARRDLERRVRADEGRGVRAAADADRSRRLRRRTTRVRRGSGPPSSTCSTPTGWSSTGASATGGCPWGR